MTRAPYFSEEDRAIIMHGYEEFKSILTTKSNTAAANKARETCWQRIAARLNASSRTGVKRTWRQIRMKYKNIIQIANRKKIDQRKMKETSPPPESTEAEKLALSQNPSRPVMEGLQEGLSSVPAAGDSQYTVLVQDDGDRIALPKLPAHVLADPLIQADNHDEETFSVVSDTPAVKGDTNSTHASVDQTSQHPPTEVAGADTVRALYKRMLELDCEKKTLEIKKLKLEIEQLEHEKKERVKK